MKKITMLALLGISVLMVACSGEKQEAKPAPEAPVIEATAAQEKAAAVEATVQEDVKQNVETAAQSVDTTTEKIGAELEKVGDAAKEKVDDGVDAAKEKVEAGVDMLKEKIAN